MQPIHDIRFPNESLDYRASRDELLKAEIELRRQIENVAGMRRRLPPGGKVRKDYVFDRVDGKGPIHLSELFQPGQNSLIVYGYMFGPEDTEPCPSCSSILDSLDGQVPHVQQRAGIVAIAKAPAPKIADFARNRGWRNLPLYSSYGTTFSKDYHAEDADGDPIPAVNVFTRSQDGVRHFYSAELLYVDPDPGQDARHADMIWPLWNLLDLIPEGRGTDWWPSLSYEPKVAV